MGIYEDLILTGASGACLFFFIWGVLILADDEMGISKAPEKLILFLHFLFGVLIPLVFAGLAFFFAAAILFREYHSLKGFEITHIINNIISVDLLIVILVCVPVFIWLSVRLCVYARNGYKEFLKRLKRDRW